MRRAVQLCRRVYAARGAGAGVTLGPRRPGVGSRGALDDCPAAPVGARPDGAASCGSHPDVLAAPAAWRPWDIVRLARRAGDRRRWWPPSPVRAPSSTTCCCDELVLGNMGSRADGGTVHRGARPPTCEAVSVTVTGARRRCWRASRREMLRHCALLGKAISQRRPGVAAAAGPGADARPSTSCAARRLHGQPARSGLVRRCCSASRRCRPGDPAVWSRWRPWSGFAGGVTRPAAPRPSCCRRRPPEQAPTDLPGLETQVAGRCTEWLDLGFHRQRPAAPARHHALSSACSLTGPGRLRARRRSCEAVTQRMGARLLRRGDRRSPALEPTARRQPAARACCRTACAASWASSCSRTSRRSARARAASPLTSYFLGCCVRRCRGRSPSSAPPSGPRAVAPACGSRARWTTS